MSERGAFVTNFIYDPKVAAALKAKLPEIISSKAGHAVVEVLPDRVFAGYVNAGYAGEESFWMKDFLEEFAQTLEPDHGMFSVVVAPESAEWACCISVHKRIVTWQWTGEKARASL